MVAIVAGNGLGLFNSSANILGNAGVLGLGALGQAGGRALVNATNGNLVLQFQDEQLSGRGHDLLQLRTYNSQGEIVNGEFTDGDGDGWRWDGERKIVLTGTANAPGSTVARIGGDGHETKDFVLAGGRYVSTEGSGTHDSLVFESATQQWVWTDGTSRLEERYEVIGTTNTWRLLSQKDSSGNVIDFEYAGGRLSVIKDHGSGQKIELTYTTTNGRTRLQQVKTFELTVNGVGRATGTLGAALKQVEYEYYDDGRLKSVSTVLDPTAATATHYTTSYTYDADKRLGSITQSDGTSVSFRYDTSNRITSVTDASGTQSFNYVSATRTDITDGNGHVWSYIYDSVTKQLKEIRTPAPLAGDTPLVTTFNYDASGNVDRIIDARGKTVVYEYDTRGNRTLERDADGNTLTRTYNSTTNQVESETRYTTKDPDGDGTGVPDPNSAMTTRFVYDGQSRLRFVVSAEGRVTENRYGTATVGFGLLTRTIQYADGRYSSATVSEAELTTWVGSQNKRQVQQTQYEYDLRGNLAKRTEFGSIDTLGEGIVDSATSITEYIYSGHGELLQTIAMRGAARDQRKQLTSYAYDGLGRETQRMNSSGTTTTAYNGAARTIQVTNAAGLVETRSFDTAGRLVSVVHSGNATTRMTEYVYDAAGRLRLVQDPQSGKRFSFYDAAGRLQYQVDSTGAVTGFEYDANGRLTVQTRYANRPTASNITSWYNIETHGVVEKDSLTVGGQGSDVIVDATLDRVTRYEYDDAGRLRTQTDAANVVTTTKYDGASRITQQQTGDRITRYFYDRDGRQVGVLDPLGYLTENKFDAAGRLVETVRYSTRSPSASNVAPPVWLGITNQTAVGGRAFTYRMPAFDADGDGLEFSVVGTKPAWLNLDKSGDGGVTLTGTPPKTLTSYDITVRASDGRTPPKTADVTVRITVANTAPTWVDLPDSRVAVNASGYSLTLPPASDNESATLVYSISQALLPPGLTFNAGTRTISGMPTIAGTYTIIARVTDGAALFTEKTFTLTVTNNGPTWAPLHNESAPPRPTFNVPYTFTVPEAVDPEGEALTYTAPTRPSWLSFDPTTRVLSGTPSAFGVEQVILEARDPNGGVAQLSFTLNVENQDPIWTDLPSLPELPWLAGVTIDHTVPAARDPEQETLTYSIVGGNLPTGWTMSGSGRITGTSSTVGNFPVTIRVADPRGGSTTRTLRIALENVAPVYHGGLQASPTNCVTGDDVSASIPAGMFTDANNDTLTYTVSMIRDGGAAASWMSFDADGNLSGRAPFVATNQFRNFGFTVTATDGHGRSASGRFFVGVAGAANDLLPGDTPSVAASGINGGNVAVLAALPPIEDVLSSLRPAASADDAHSYQYYDAQGRVVGSVDERGFLSETVYDEQAHTQQNVQYMNAVSVVPADTLDILRTAAGSLKETTKIEYDDQGRVIAHTVMHGTEGATVTRNEYDSAGRLVREVRAAGTDEQRASRIRYNAFGEVTGTVGGEGDASGLSEVDAIAQYGMQYEYDSLGRRTKAIDANNSITLFYYDREGRLTHTVNAKGEISESVYNSFGQLQSERRYARRLSEEEITTLQAAGGGLASDSFRDLVAAQAVADKDQTTNYTYDQRGLVTQITDGEGFATSNSYNAFGQLSTRIRAILNGQSVTTQFDYDLRGSLLSTSGDVGGINFNRQHAYDAFGRVIKSVDGAGNATTTVYRDSGRTIEVTDALNRMVRSKYDAYSRVLEQIDARGQSTLYKYDNVARSVKVTTPEGVSVTTTRTRHGETLTVVDGRGSTSRYTYDKDGHLKTVTDARDNVVATNEYDKSGRLIETRDARGIETRFSYDALNRMFERRVDPRGQNNVNPSGLDLVTTYQFNAFGQQLRVTEGTGNNRNGNSARVTEYKYDRKGQLTHVIVDPDALNLTTTYSYNGLGNTIKVERGTLDSPRQQATLYVFDKLGRRVKEIAIPSAIFGAATSGTRDLTTEYRYDAAGRVSRRIDAIGQSTWYVYDKAGQQIQTINGLGEVSESSYDANGRVVRTHRYFNRLSADALAGFGDVVSVVAPAVNQKDQRSYFVYDNDGRQRYALLNTAGTNWAISESRYDASGNVIETRRYDKFLADGRVTAIAAAGITAAEVLAELTALGYTEAENTLTKIQRTRHAYDANNRLRFSVGALGSVSENVYDNAGNVVSSVRYAVRPTLTTYTESAINGAVDRASTSNQVSHFIYDAAGRLRYNVQVLANNTEGQPTHLVSRQTYDALGRVVRTDAYATAMTLADYTTATLDAAVNTNKSAQDRTTAMMYDAAGRQVYSVRAAGANATGQPVHVVSQQIYDDLGQIVTSIAYARTMVLADYTKATLDTAVALSENKSPQDRRTAFVYDAAGRQVYSVRVLAINAQGAATQHLVSQRMYDALGQVVTSTLYAKAMTLADYARSTLDAAVNLDANRSTQDRTTAFTYDTAGRQCFAVAADGSLSETVYDSFGQVTERRRFDLLVSAPTPGMPYRESDLSSARAVREVGDGVTRGEKYVYSRSGQLLSTTDALGFVESYAYDELGNRKSYTDKNGKQWTYTYDRLGRLRTQESPLVEVRLSTETAPTSRHLTTLMEYDALGNLTARTEAQGTDDARTTSYGYDRLGRQIVVTQPGHYDPNTGRVVKVATGASFQRTLETSYDALGNEVRTKLRTGADRYQYEYKTYDALGRIVHDLDALNQVTAFAYTSFGEQSAVTRHSIAVSGAPANVDYWTAGEIADKVANDDQARTAVMSYDNLGRKSEVRQPTVDYYNRSTGLTESAQPATRYEYNAFGELVHEAVKVETFDFREWRDTWHYFDAMGRETRTIDAARFHTARSYDALGNLKQTIEYANEGGAGDLGVPPGTPAESSKDRITRFSYNALNQQTQIERLGLRFTRWTGSGYEEVNTTRDTATIVASTTYDSVGRVRTRTDALGNVTTTQYNALGQVTGVIEPARQVAKRPGDGAVIDPFRPENQVIVSPTTTFTLNAFGQIVKQERNPGVDAQGVPAAGEMLATHVEYDFAGNAIGSTDAKNNTKSRQYDYAGRVIVATQSIQTRSVNVPGAPPAPMMSQTLERRYAYDAVGRQTDVTDVFQDTYIDRSRTVTLMQSGQRSKFNAFGEVVEERRIFGAASVELSSLGGALTATYRHDKAGRVIEKRAADGLTAYFYDLAGQVIRQEQRGVEDDGTLTALVRLTETGYDELGRAERKTLPMFNSVSANSIRPVVLQSHDRWGNVVLQSRGLYLHADGTLADEQRVITRYQYNADNQVIAEELPTTSAFKEDGTRYDARMTHALRYDLLGRVVQELDLVADDAATAVNEEGTLRVRSKEYNAVGQLVAETDGTSIRTQYVYDAHGNRVGTRNALGTVFVDKFDSNGNLTDHGVLRHADRKTEYFNGPGAAAALAYVTLNQHEYDQANRRTGSAVAITVDSAPVWSYVQLDERGYSRAQRNASGVLTQCEYDALGNKRLELDARENGQSYTYSESDFSVGRLRSTEVQDGAAGDHAPLTYTYDAFGQLKREQRAAIRIVSGYDYSYEYHDNGLLKKTENLIGRTQNHSSTLEAMEYEYTVLGQRAVERSWVVRTTLDGRQLAPTDNRHTVTTYDVLGRMQTVSAPPTLNAGRPALNGLAYSYDELGNRRNIVANYGNGERSDRWFTYDKEGRMTLVDGERKNDGPITAGKGSTILTYDGLGRRSTAQKYDKDNSWTAGAFPLPPPEFGTEQFITYWTQYRTERYSYNDLSYLMKIERAVTQREKHTDHLIDGKPFGTPEGHADQQGEFLLFADYYEYELRGTRTRSREYTDFIFKGPDAQNAVLQLQSETFSSYRADGLLNHQSVSREKTDLDNTELAQGFDINSSLVNHYDDAGVLRSYEYTPGARITSNRGLSTFRTDQLTLHYELGYTTVFGGYKEDLAIVRADKPDNSDATLPGVGTTRSRYNARGLLLEQTIDNPAQTRTLRFKYDNEGHITTKYEGVEDEQKGVQDYYYAEGRQVGIIGTGTLQMAEFSNDFTALSAAYPGATPGSYVVNRNDTLAAIAERAYGDAQLWYLIADANSLSFGPTGVLPDIEVGKTYRLPNVVTNFHNNANTFSPYNPAAIIGDSTPVPGLPAPPEPVCQSTAGRILATAVVIAVSAAVSSFLAPASPVLAAVAASLASQGTAAGLGLQDGISGGKIAAAGVTAGFNNAAFGGIDSAGRAYSGALNSANGFANIASSSLVGTASNVFTGNKFSLRGALMDLGTQLAVHGAFPSSYQNQQADPAAAGFFHWGRDLEGVISNALNPNTGWVFNRDSRDWASIASQAVNAFAGRVGDNIGRHMREITTGATYSERQARAQAGAHAGSLVADGIGAVRDLALAALHRVANAAEDLVSDVVMAADIAAMEEQVRNAPRGVLVAENQSVERLAPGQRRTSVPGIDTPISDFVPTGYEPVDSMLAAAKLAVNQAFIDANPGRGLSLDEEGNVNEVIEISDTKDAAELRRAKEEAREIGAEHRRQGEELEKKVSAVIGDAPVLEQDQKLYERPVYRGPGGIIRYHKPDAAVLSKGAASFLTPLIRKGFNAPQFDATQVPIHFVRSLPSGRDAETRGYGTFGGEYLATVTVEIDETAWHQKGRLAQLGLLAHEFAHVVQNEAINSYPLHVPNLLHIRYWREADRKDNYDLPDSLLLETPFENLDPLDRRYTMDQTAERAHAEVIQQFGIDFRKWYGGPKVVKVVTPPADSH